MIDIKQNEDGDVAIEDGDVAYTESTGQHKRDILLADKGHFKEHPVAGVGAANFIHDADPSGFYRTTRRECSRDGMKVKDIRVTGGEIEIDAEYENSNS